jgi:hypothetical protein
MENIYIDIFKMKHRDHSWLADDGLGVLDFNYKARSAADVKYFDRQTGRLSRASLLFQAIKLAF